MLTTFPRRPAAPPEPDARWRWLFDGWLLLLFLGPILSPLFRSSDVFLIDYTGTLARDVLIYICPTPAQSYMVGEHPMAVCARCWGATIGLWGARLWVPAMLRGNGTLTHMLNAFSALPWYGRLALCAVPFALWVLEIAGVGAQWWGTLPLWVLLLNGAQAGFAAGLFFCSVWKGFWQYHRDRASYGR